MNAKHKEHLQKVCKQINVGQHCWEVVSVDQFETVVMAPISPLCDVKISANDHGIDMIYLTDGDDNHAIEYNSVMEIYTVNEYIKKMTADTNRRVKLFDGE